MKLLETPPDQRMLDGYELVGELARGGMACVYVARRGGAGGFNRWVAIKRLDPRFACDETYAKMVLDEARLAARIHHPNVSSILEIGGGPERPAADGSDSRGDYYMVMEYVEGCTLAQLVDRVQQGPAARPLARRVVLRIVLDVLAGLQAAHELTDDHGMSIDLVHRDCTPHNILVGANGNTRIADFGLARASARLTKTAVGTLKGKLAYMAPEQVNDGAIDLRTDLFTVGIVLWEALTGQRLFRAENDLATLERILRAPITRLSTLIPSVAPGLEDVCARALQRNAERRFASAAKMADAIEAAAAASTSLEGGVASRDEVAEVVERLFGTELSARRQQLRSRLTDCMAEDRSSWPGRYPSDSVPPGDDRINPDRPSVTTITMSYDGETLEACSPVLDAHVAARRRLRWTRGMLTAAAAMGLVTLAWAGAAHLSSRFDDASSDVPPQAERDVSEARRAGNASPADAARSNSSDSARAKASVAVKADSLPNAPAAIDAPSAPSGGAPAGGASGSTAASTVAPTPGPQSSTDASLRGAQTGPTTDRGAPPSGSPRTHSPPTGGSPPTGDSPRTDSPPTGDSPRNSTALPPNELSNPYR